MIAKRYARALEQYARQNGERESVYGEALDLLQGFAAQKSLRQRLTAPILKAEAKFALLQGVFGRPFSPSLAEFLRLVLRHKREEELELMLHAYRSLYQEQEGLHEVRLTTPHPFPKETSERLQAVLQERLGGEIHLEERLDEQLLGGFSLQVDDWLVDTSLAGRLKRIRAYFGGEEVTLSEKILNDE